MNILNSAVQPKISEEIKRIVPLIDQAKTGIGIYTKIT